jgi:hypothetical protein
MCSLKLSIFKLEKFVFKLNSVARGRQFIFKKDSKNGSSDENKFLESRDVRDSRLTERQILLMWAVVKGSVKLVLSDGDIFAAPG